MNEWQNVLFSKVNKVGFFLLVSCLYNKQNKIRLLGDIEFVLTCSTRCLTNEWEISSSALHEKFHISARPRAIDIPSVLVSGMLRRNRSEERPAVFAVCCKIRCLPQFGRGWEKERGKKWIETPEETIQGGKAKWKGRPPRVRPFTVFAGHPWCWSGYFGDRTPKESAQTGEK